MITLYDAPRSGHSYRARLLLGLLGIPYASVVVQGAERKATWFLAKNPLGQIPVIEDDGVVVPDSNAILVYLAKKYDRSGTWLPEDPAGAARVQRWLSIAAGELVIGVVKPRSARLFGREYDAAGAEAARARLLPLLEGHLAQHPFLAADHPTIADVSLFSYLTVADEGGLDLSPYASIVAWMARFEALPGYAPIPRS